jgi:hypothetical protein
MAPAAVEAALAPSAADGWPTAESRP